MCFAVSTSSSDGSCSNERCSSLAAVLDKIRAQTAGSIDVVIDPGVWVVPNRGQIGATSFVGTVQPAAISVQLRCAASGTGVVSSWSATSFTPLPCIFSCIPGNAGLVALVDLEMSGIQIQDCAATSQDMTLNVGGSDVTAAVGPLGGAIFATMGAHVHLNETAFVNNVALGVGGAVALASATLSVERSYFSFNSAGSGGAIVAAEFAQETIIFGLTVQVVQLSETSVAVGDSWFVSNTATLAGGAVLLSEASIVTTTHSFSGVSFTDNSAASGGALVCLSCRLVAVSNAIFAENTATQLPDASEGIGGAVLVDGSTSAVQMGPLGSIFRYNAASAAGGAVALAGGCTLSSVSASPIAFEGNKALDGMGGAFIAQESSINLLGTMSCSRNKAGLLGACGLLSDSTFFVAGRFDVEFNEQAERSAPAGGYAVLVQPFAVDPDSRGGGAIAAVSSSLNMTFLVTRQNSGSKGGAILCLQCSLLHISEAYFFQDSAVDLGAELALIDTVGRVDISNFHMAGAVRSWHRRSAVEPERSYLSQEPPSIVQGGPRGADPKISISDSEKLWRGDVFPRNSQEWEDAPVDNQAGVKQFGGAIAIVGGGPSSHVVFRGYPVEDVIFSRQNTGSPRSPGRSPLTSSSISSYQVIGPSTLESGFGGCVAIVGAPSVTFDHVMINSCQANSGGVLAVIDSKVSVIGGMMTRGIASLSLPSQASVFGGGIVVVLGESSEFNATGSSMFGSRAALGGGLACYGGAHVNVDKSTIAMPFWERFRDRVCKHRRFPGRMVPCNLISSQRYRMDQIFPRATGFTTDQSDDLGVFLGTIAGGLILVGLPWSPSLAGLAAELPSSSCTMTLARSDLHSRFMSNGVGLVMVGNQSSLTLNDVQYTDVSTSVGSLALVRGGTVVANNIFASSSAAYDRQLYTGGFHGEMGASMTLNDIVFTPFAWNFEEVSASIQRRHNGPYDNTLAGGGTLFTVSPRVFDLPGQYYFDEYEEILNAPVNEVRASNLFIESVSTYSAGAAVFIEGRAFVSVENLTAHTLVSERAAAAIMIGGDPVDFSGSNDFPPLNVHLKNIHIVNTTGFANSGGAIAVYHPSANVSIENMFLKGCTLFGTGGGGCIAAANGASLRMRNVTMVEPWVYGFGGAALVVESGATVSATDFHVLAAKAFNSGVGGAVVVTEPSSLFNCDQCSFVECSSADSHGGAVLINSGASASITNSKFERVRAGRNGGAIMVTDARSSLILTSTVFVSVDAAGVGGAVAVAGGAFLSISKSKFLAPTSLNAGGSVNIQNSAGILADCVFNLSRTVSATGVGGAIACSNCQLQLFSLQLSGSSSALGADVHVTGIGSIIHGSEIVSNGARSEAGGCFATRNSAAVYLTDCAFYNAKSSTGGALSILQGSSVALEGNSTFHGCSASGNGGTFSVSGSGSKLDVSGVALISHTHAQIGGAVSIASRGAVNLWNSELQIDGAAADSGGGAFDLQAQAALTLSGSKLFVNQATTQASGGAFRVSGGSVLSLDDTSSLDVQGCSAGTLGGGMHLTGSGTSFMAAPGMFLSSVSFSNCSAITAGAGMAVAEAASADLQGSLLRATGCVLLHPSGQGAGLYLGNSAVAVFSEIVITHNQAAGLSSSGAGIHLSDSVMTVRGRAQLANNRGSAQGISCGAGMSAVSSSAVFASVNATGNSCQHGFGGAFALIQSSLSISGSANSSSWLQDNAAIEGASFFLDSSSYLTLSSPVVVHTAATAGGFLKCARESSSSFTSELSVRVSGLPAMEVSAIEAINCALHLSGSIHMLNLQPAAVRAVRLEHSQATVSGRLMIENFGSPDLHEGGGLHLSDKSVLWATVNSSVLLLTNSARQGGGAHVSSGSALVSGPAIAAARSLTSEEALICDHNALIGNTPSGISFSVLQNRGLRGAGVYASGGSTVCLSAARIEHNVATESAGAIELDSVDPSSFLHHVSIRDNSAGCSRAGLVCRGGASGRCAAQTLWVYSSLIDANTAPQTVRKDVSCGSGAASFAQCEVFAVPEDSTVPAAAMAECQASRDGQAAVANEFTQLCESADKRERSWYITPIGSNLTCCGAEATPCGSLTAPFRVSSLQSGDALLFERGLHTVIDQPIVTSNGERLGIEGTSLLAASSATLLSTGPSTLLQVTSTDSSATSVLAITNISIQASAQQISPVISCIGTASTPSQLSLTNVVLSSATQGTPARATAIFALNCMVELHNVTIIGFGGAAIQISSASSTVIAKHLNITSGFSENGGSALRISRQASARFSLSSISNMAVASGQSGGAIHCSEAASFACHGCQFLHNGQGVSSGGDVYAHQCSVVLSNSTSVGSRAIQGAHAFIGLSSDYTATNISVQSAVAGLGESGTGGAFHVEDKSSLVVAHLHAEACQSGDRGGVIFAADSQVQLNHARMIHSNATNDGGCIALTSASSLKAAQVDFKHCAAQSLGQGGGLFLQQESEATLTSVTMSYCAASAGGCISATSSTLVLDAVALTDSSAVSTGGCVLFEAGAEMVSSQRLDSSDLTLHNCSTQLGDGGGIEVLGLPPAGVSPRLNVTLAGLLASNCRATSGSGGGISVQGFTHIQLLSSAQRATALIGCEAIAGGALSGNDGVFVDVIGARFSANVAAERGGAVFTAALSLMISDSTFFNNSVSFAGASDFPELYSSGASSLYCQHSPQQALVVSQNIFLEPQTAIVSESRPTSDCSGVSSCTNLFFNRVRQWACPAAQLRARRCSQSTSGSNAIPPMLESGALWIANNSMGSMQTLSFGMAASAFVSWSGDEPKGVATNMYCGEGCHNTLSEKASSDDAVLYLASLFGKSSQNYRCDVQPDTSCAVPEFLPAIAGVIGSSFTYKATQHESVSVNSSSGTPGNPLPGFYVWPVDIYGVIAGSHLPANRHFAQLNVQAVGKEDTIPGDQSQSQEQAFSAVLTTSTTMKEFEALPSAVLGEVRATSAHPLWPSYMAWIFLNSTALVPETPDSIWQLSIGGSELPLPAARFSSCRAGYAPANTLPGQAADGARCHACPIGTFSSSGKACEACPAGQFTSRTGSSDCVACAPGTHQPNRGASCVPCADGTYTAQPGQISCLQCPRSGVSCISGTIELLSGFYFVGLLPRQQQGNSSAARSLVFPSARAASQQLVVLNLNESLVTRDTQVFGCLSQYGCVASGDRVECAVGHEGIACGSCRSGFVPSGSACQECFPPAVSWLMLIGLGAASIGLVAAAAVRQTFSDTAPFKIAIRMGLNHIQILTLTGMLRARGTLLFRQWFALLESVTGLGIASPFAALRCLFKASAYTEFTAAVSFPVLLCVVAAFSGSIAACITAQANRRWYEPGKYLLHGHFGSTWVFIGFICYAVVTMAVLNAVRCTDAAILGSRWLINDMQVPCYEGAHIGVVVVACTIGLLFCLGFPMLTAIILSRNKEELKQKSSALARRFGFLVSGLKLDRAYYESVVMLRKMLLSCIILVANPVYQSVIGMLLMFASLNLQLLWSPYARPIFNYLEAASLWSIIITLMLSLSYLEEEQSEADLQADPNYVSASERWSTGLLLTVNLAYTVVLLATVARLFMQHRSSRQKKATKAERAPRLEPRAVLGGSQPTTASSSSSGSVLLPVKAGKSSRASAGPRPQNGGIEMRSLNRV